jgi:hypothetical protein
MERYSGGDEDQRRRHLDALDLTVMRRDLPSV